MPRDKTRELFEKALARHRSEDFAAAEGLYRKVLQRRSGHHQTLHQMGLLKAQTGDLDAARSFFGQAIAVDPGVPETFLYLAHVLVDAGLAEDALLHYDRALALHPDYPEAWYGRGNALQGMRRHREAIASYDRALVLAPGQIELLVNRGNALHDEGDLGTALGDYDRAITLRPEMAMLHNNRGNILREMGRFSDAIASLERALKLDPDYVDAIINLGSVQRDAGAHEEAYRTYRRGLQLDPSHAFGLNNCANLLLYLRKYEEAGRIFEHLRAVRPDWDYIDGLWAHCRRAICDWRDFDIIADSIISAVNAGKKACTPFLFQAFSDSAAAQLQCARIYMLDNYPSRVPLWNGERYAHDRVRVAYVSADFRDHPVSNLMVGVLEHHDESRFEIIGISLAASDGSPAGDRVRASFGRLIDASRKTAVEVAALMRELEVDIAVDLMGYTQGNRPGIFARRPCPVQVNYLGFAGSMGAPYMDYIIADRVIIPEDQRRHYTEHVVYMPDSFQANDDRRHVVRPRVTRLEEGLPEDGFVFCCFNSAYKITPAMFDCWAGILKSADNSVLWLLAEGPVVESNLRSEAAFRGVDPSRLIFARRVPYAEHLARMSLADLFLDTLPVNAGATASDVLFSGVPVLTCPGNSFASRMAGSLLMNLNLPEMVAKDPDDYSALAVKLATVPELLGGLRARLHSSLLERSGLFDTARFCRNLEAAYRMMHERSLRGEPPASFCIDRQ